LIESSDLKGKYDNMFDRESAYEVLSMKFNSHGVTQTAVVQQIPLQQDLSESPMAPEQPTVKAMTFKVYDPSTGSYVEREMAAPEAYTPPSQTVYAPQPQAQPPAVQQQPQVPAAPKGNPPVLVYNPKTGQYEPQEITRAEKAKAEKPVKQQPSTLDRMLQSFTRSTASGAGYTVGRSITRNILGVFGIK